ncbi:collagenase [Streptomyces alkaliterrae]|uniref:microbial collagenase n=1 Tax=Streptomyces alkaliterrae TaxID=2213162 RepID=A0A5P0Z0D2_9ACTN|nr:collagenase [Streptomyces alkaliterrae]MBB1258162.1 collagenase [Streptomyces alkaliterrae]MQS05039.1 collagenase [Streptomyces alkaliterrae]
MVAILASSAQLGQATAAPAAPPAQPRATAPTTPVDDRHPHDEVDRLAKAPAPGSHATSAPGEGPEGRVPGLPDAAADNAAPPVATANKPATTEAGVPCTLDGVTGLSPTGLADFLTDEAVTADGCLSTLIWNWDARLAPIMSAGHIQAVARRATTLAPGHDGRNGSGLLELFTYLHAVAYHEFSRDEVDLSDRPTSRAVRRAVTALGDAPRTFDATATNAQTLREALYTASAPGLRHHQLDLITRVLATMGPNRPATHKDPDWAGAALAALVVSYLGMYEGNNDTAFRQAVAAAPWYRAAFRAFGDHTHLKGTANAWVVRDAVSEYGRFGLIPHLKTEIVGGLGDLLDRTTRNFGHGSPPWAKVASWLNEYDACKPHGVCRDDIERRIFPHTYTYDEGTIRVRTALDRATVDQLYYAGKQVKAQFHRVLGSREPLADDPNTTLTTVLYASRADYEAYHPLLTGMGTDNGGIYIERTATFYTYQRRVPEDSRLTLEELYRHEYTHYLNGRWAVPGFFGEGPWYKNDRTTAMDEGTAEFFAGATRDDGVAVRKSLVQGIINDTREGRPRMTVRDILHATYSGDGFRFYSYAGTLFEYLWTERPALIREMYTHLRADAPAAYDAWRSRLSGDAALQTAYNRFLDRQIAVVDDLFVPNTRYTPLDRLTHSTADSVRTALVSATGLDPACTADADQERPRFTCTGRITARLSDADSPDKVFKDMSETVDYFILRRAGRSAESTNLADMNCDFGPVQIWSDGRGGTSDYSCEGPLRP